jgi:Type ISP C-terminal specificity domain
LAESPDFYFLPKDLTNSDPYKSGFKVNELFAINNSGIVTARDPLVIDFNASELIVKINRFSDDNKTDDEVRSELYGTRKAGKYLAGDSRGWKLSIAKKKVKANNHYEIAEAV